MPGVYVPQKGPDKLRRKRLFWGGGISGGIILIIAALLWIFLFSPLFELKAVSVQGAKDNSSGDILSVIQSHIGRGWLGNVLGAKNMLAWPASLDAADLRFLPQVKSVSIDKDWQGHTAQVLVLERDPVAMWCMLRHDPPQCFWFDSEGVLMKKGFNTQGNLIRVVDDYAQDSLVLGDKVLPDAFLPNLLDIMQTLQATGLSVKEVALRDLSHEEISAATYGPTLYFSLRFPPEGVADVLNSLHKSGKWNSVQYVDFRVEHRAYYK